MFSTHSWAATAAVLDQSHDLVPTDTRIILRCGTRISHTAHGGMLWKVVDWVFQGKLGVVGAWERAVNTCVCGIRGLGVGLRKPLIFWVCKGAAGRLGVRKGWATVLMV